MHADQDDRPYLRHEPRSFALPAALAAVLIAVLAGLYRYGRGPEPAPPGAPPLPTAAEPAPRRAFPLNSVAGAFGAAGKGESLAIGPANAARYAAHVQVLEALDARGLVQGYAQLYPLFQRAYEELGHPGKHFNDRLLEAIEDLLGAPEIGPPIGLLQPKVLYQFADPDLETRSAGQKILVRMGKDNAARVKAKLREIRRELLAAAGRH